MLIALSTTSCVYDILADC